MRLSVVGLPAAVVAIFDDKPMENHGVPPAVLNQRLVMESARKLKDEGQLGDVDCGLLLDDDHGKVRKRIEIVVGGDSRHKGKEAPMPMFRIATK